MRINLSTVPKRYLIGGGLFLLLLLGLIIGAVHPYKSALGSQPAALPEVQVLQVQLETHGEEIVSRIEDFFITRRTKAA